LQSWTLTFSLADGRDLLIAKENCYLLSHACQTLPVSSPSKKSPIARAPVSVQKTLLPVTRIKCWPHYAKRVWFLRIDTASTRLQFRYWDDSLCDKKKRANELAIGVHANALGRRA
jgi:hypothetical protein